MHRAFTTLLVACALSWTGIAHAAAGSVSLIGVTGGERFADELEEDLAELYELVPGDVYRHTANRIGQRGASPEAVSAVCRAIHLDALIAGSVTGEGDARQLMIVVREGLTGDVVSRTRYDLSTRTLPLVRAQVMRDLMRTLDELQRVPRGVVPTEPVPRPTEEVAPEPDTYEPADLSTKHVAPTTRAPPRGFFAAVGPGVMTRSLVFDGSSAPGYSRGAVATIQAEGGVFPLALSRELADAHPALASFGLLASYERAFSFTSSTASGSASGSASRWNALFVGRIPLGHAARGGTLSIETGFQRLSWHSSSATTLGVPDVTYALVDAGLGWDRSLGTRYLELGVRLAAQGLVDGGSIMSTAEYGRGTGWGLDLDATLTARPARWLWLRAVVRYTPLFLSLHEAGARFARGATDQFADAVIEVGFAL